MFLKNTLSIKSPDQRLWPGRSGEGIFKQDLLGLVISMDIIK